MGTAAERLSSLDAFFLEAEHDNTHMHIGATLVFEMGRFRKSARRSEIDIDKIRAYVASRLHLIPRYRQRLARTPLEGRPIWIDDDRFDLENHVVHVRLPRPGSQRELKEAVAEILAEPLDRSRPLWQFCVIDGLRRGRFAVVTKLHHSMADGIGGVEQLCVLLTPSPDPDDDHAPDWAPRPIPGTLELLADEARSATRSWVDSLGTVGQALRQPRQSLEQTWNSAASVADAVRTSLSPAAKTPFNRPIGADRRVEWLRFDLEEMRRVKRALGGTLNDVVLATVAGALRRYLQAHRFDAEAAEIRAAVPVSMRDADCSSGNQVSIWFVPLPVEEGDATTRLYEVRSATTRLKSSQHAQGLYSMLRFADYMTPALVRAGIRAVERMLPFNLIVTNVPGPKFPLYMGGARLLSAYPMVPLFAEQGLGVALFSYDGALYWGFLADPEVVPDLDGLARAVIVSFRELLKQADGGAASIHPQDAHPELPAELMMAGGFGGNGACRGALAGRH